MTTVKYFTQYIATLIRQRQENIILAMKIKELNSNKLQCRKKKTNDVA